jgi:copper chaperone CopZ
MANENLPDCCKPSGNKEGTGFLAGIAYGLVPHIGCIAFLIFSVLGATVAASFFRPLLLSRTMFYALIALSIVFATLSAFFYLKKHEALSVKGAAGKWKYLSVLYGTTIGVNLLMFLVVFPYAANITPINYATGAVTGIQSAPPAFQQPGVETGRLTLQVNIPCPGHASLISGELRKVSGVSNVKFSMPNLFEVTYDPSKASKEQILALDIFGQYPAKVV